ncbi:putative Zn2Cys6 transcription factor [Thozetella sp. PMI_491]|nr:putative Zn2Cys6 transcription factor [Thozetella sp. PMI_491]
MLRRRHKKARGGCLECKRRHVKCDQGRPVCLLCSLSRRDCSYGPQDSLGTRSASETSPPDRGASPAATQTQAGGVLPETSSPATASPSHSGSEGLGHNGFADAVASETINLSHTELLTHLIFDDRVFDLGRGPGVRGHGLQRALLFEIATASPYLLYQLFAFSARHLSFLHPERSASYRHQAFTLQTRAIELFNASTALTGVDRSNCVPVLLFSSILGHHILADTLDKRDPGGLQAFMSHYVQCVEVQRGIFTVAIASWPLLMESELEPILSWSAGFTSQAPQGNDCREISELIEAADGLEEEEKAVCRLAIKHLQVGFDAVHMEDRDVRHQMIVLWMLHVPPQFTGFLDAKRPEALAVLAYWALLLHYGRHMWQVGDAGSYLMGLIVEYLGAEWSHWLDYPRERMAEVSGEIT